MHPTHPNHQPHPTELYYSNEDVQILHDIVVLAQELLPNLPERERLPTNALFNAYYDILPRAGIDADHDSRYARILFKIGGLRGPGTLFQKFEDVLDRMGIDIRFSEGSAEEDNDQLDDSQTGHDSLATDGASPQHKSPNRPRFSSTEQQHTHTTDGTFSEYESPDRPRFSSTEKYNLVTEGTSPQYESPNRRRCNSESSAWDLANQSPTKPRSNSLPNGEQYDVQRFEERTLQEQHSGQHSDQHNVQQSEGAETLENSLDEQLAAKLRRRQLAMQAVAKLRGWKEKALQAQQKTEDERDETLDNPVDEELAAKLRRRQLAMQAAAKLRGWKEKALQAQQKREELEEVAENHDREALLQSALEAWRNRLREQQEEELRVTSIARKFWDIWREKVEESKRREQLAAAMYKRNLLRNLAAKLGRAKVPQPAGHSAVNEKVPSIPTRKPDVPQPAGHSTINDKVPSIPTRKPDVPQPAGHSTINDKVPSIPTRKPDVPQPAGHSAVNDKVFSIPTRDLDVLQDPGLSEAILHKTLDTWRDRSAQEALATKVDQTKLLKEAITLWRHKTRLAEMRDRIDDRVKGQALRAWILAARSRLAEYRKKESSLRMCLRAWKSRREMAAAQRQEREEMAQSFASRQSANLVLRQWYSKMGEQQRNETAALDFHAPRLVSSALTKWTDKSKHIQHLEQRSRDADFYFLASRSLKAWKTATETSKREKRKQAYIQVRRNGKINLAKAILEKWRSKARPIMELQAQALKARQDRDIVIAIDIFDRWRARTDYIQGLGVTAEEHVLRKHLISWKDRLKEVEAVDTEASLHYQEAQESKHFKKWGLKTLQIRAHNNTAAEVREKNSKRNVRRIFGYWRQRAELRKQEHRGEDIPSNVPPIPGYLNTPSRRSVRFTTTTPRAPLSTPAERRLRSQWS